MSAPPPGTSMFSETPPERDFTDEYVPEGIERDRWGRPKILQSNGLSKAYVRASTMAKALDDGKALSDWKARTVGKGVATNPDLIANFAVVDIDDPGDGKKRAAELVEMAMERAGASRKRELGTALHSFTELIDRGEHIAHVPEALQPALRSYVRETHGIRWLAYEQFVVNDEHEVAGTADRFGHRADWRLPRVLDVKTGRVDYGGLSFAAQLAIYASGRMYDPLTGERADLPFPVDQEVGIIIHLDPVTSTTTLYPIDLALGRRAIAAAIQVRELRKIGARKVKRMAATTLTRIFDAQTLDELNEVHAETKPWSEHEVKAANQRAAELRVQGVTS